MPDPTRTVWRKSTASESGTCVEVAFAAHGVLVRRSHEPAGPLLTFTEPEWAAFVTGVRNGEFDTDAPSVP
jgi:predicted secreted Zn-dependent protease